ncbi:MAG: synthase ferredoxin-like domain, partial [Firmicutes bacterium]|nr:synthase ferredoxin-like domain [Bacillota bacterium]
MIIVMKPQARKESIERIKNLIESKG